MEAPLTATLLAAMEQVKCREMHRWWLRRRAERKQQEGLPEVMIMEAPLSATLLHRRLRRRAEQKQQEGLPDSEAMLMEAQLSATLLHRWLRRRAERKQHVGLTGLVWRWLAPTSVQGRLHAPTGVQGTLHGMHSMPRGWRHFRGFCWLQLRRENMSIAKSCTKCLEARKRKQSRACPVIC
jgi:hypothetical protein